MPEGPELHLASRYINAACAGLVFCGPVEKSEVSKNPEVPFRSDAYRISAASRGKEVKLTLAPLRAEAAAAAASGERGRAGPQQPMDLVFRFGMSGGFTLAPEAELPKHAHLRFYTRERPRRALCFVDLRRFGRWEVQGTWQPDRGPCVLLEYEQFRENVLKNLSDKAFNKPICEALLNQKFFNGIGNYLRAEILYRLKIPPFEKARTVLEALQHRKQSPGLTLSKKVKLRRENPDLVELCHTVPLEVVHLGGKGYSLEHSADAAAFEEWLQCYSVPGMKALRDSNGRTIWFHGEPGPMAPKGEKSLKKRSRANTDPEPPNPKVTKPASQGGRSREKVTKRSGREKGKELVQGAENAQSNETRKPKARSRRKASASQESPKSEAPAAGRKRRASARRSAGTAATTRSRRAKVE
ncbi:endonuclease 8-like 1 isoform X2 [Carettochelys insculpta]|uniref:endonuclease 8-like 1 isoform X2 n=1 Tax=Carettochelys insculpta TaxID=44489 RepID=UPI003EBC097D